MNRYFVILSAFAILVILPFVDLALLGNSFDDWASAIRGAWPGMVSVLAVVLVFEVLLRKEAIESNLRRHSEIMNRLNALSDEIYNLVISKLLTSDVAVTKINKQLSRLAPRVGELPKFWSFIEDSLKECRLMGDATVEVTLSSQGDSYSAVLRESSSIEARGSVNLYIALTNVHQVCEKMNSGANMIDKVVLLDYESMKFLPSVESVIELELTTNYAGELRKSVIRKIPPTIITDVRPLVSDLDLNDEEVSSLVIVMYNIPSERGVDSRRVNIRVTDIFEKCYRFYAWSSDRVMYLRDFIVDGTGMNKACQFYVSSFNANTTQSEENIGGVRIVKRFNNWLLPGQGFFVYWREE